MGHGIGASLFVQSIFPVVADLGVSRSDVIAWGAALIAVLLIAFMVARLRDIVRDDEAEEE